MGSSISQLASLLLADANVLLAGSQLSSTVTMTASTLSVNGTDKSINDSGSAFVSEGFAVGDRVKIIGFGTSANNLVSGKITALTSGKMTIAGADGAVLTTEAAGASVTVARWESYRITAEDLATIVSAGGGGGAILNLIASSTVGAAVTSVSFSSLDLDTDVAYLILYRISAATGTNNTLTTSLNGDTTLANYARSYFVSHTGGIAAGNSAHPSSPYVAGSDTAFGAFLIFNDLTGRARMVTYNLSGSTTGNIEQAITSARWTNTNNVTSITFTGGVASGIATGSEFKLYRIEY